MYSKIGTELASYAARAILYLLGSKRKPAGLLRRASYSKARAFCTPFTKLNNGWVDNNVPGPGVAKRTPREVWAPRVGSVGSDSQVAGRPRALPWARRPVGTVAMARSEDETTRLDELVRRRAEVDVRLARYKKGFGVLFADIAGSTDSPPPDKTFSPPLCTRLPVSCPGCACAG